MRGILRKKQEQGVSSLEDWDRLESQREAMKAGRSAGKGCAPGQDVQPESDRIRRNSDWLDQFLAEQEGRQV